MILSQKSAAEMTLLELKGENILLHLTKHEMFDFVLDTSNSRCQREDVKDTIAKMDELVKVNNKIIAIKEMLLFKKG